MEEFKEIKTVRMKLERNGFQQYRVMIYFSHENKLQ